MQKSNRNKTNIYMISKLIEISPSVAKKKKKWAEILSDVKVIF